MRSLEEERRIRALLDQSEHAYAARQGADAMRLLLEARNISPEHPLVLNAAGIHALSEGHAAEARELFNRALAGEKKTAALYVNLAAALRQLQCLDEEAEALERALALEPRNLLPCSARQRSRIAAETSAWPQPSTPTPCERCSRGNRCRRACAQRCPRRSRRWRKIPGHWSDICTTALAKVRTGLEASPRFDHALDALLGRRRIYQPQPTQFHFPKLPALEFYPRDQFPWLATAGSRHRGRARGVRTRVRRGPEPARALHRISGWGAAGSMA